LFFGFCFLRGGLFRTKSNAFLRDSPRQAARAVKAAVFAFIGAKRRALTEEAGGLAQPLSRKALRRKARLAEVL